MFEGGVEVTSVGVESSPQERVGQDPHRQNGDAVQALTHKVLDTGRLTNLNQVLSRVTQFNSVRFLPSRIIATKGVFMSTQSRFTFIVFSNVLGPPRLARHT